MRCDEFLRHYYDLRDGRLDDRRLLKQLDRHLARCRRCARYHASLRRGLEVLQETEEIDPSPSFRIRLEHRLRQEASIGDPLVPTNLGIAAALLLAAAVGLVFYEGLAATPGTAPAAVAAIADSDARPAASPTFAAAPLAPRSVDFTLPAFGDTAVQFSSSSSPLGTWVSLGR
ncbi:MAG TPA: hypothetical protein VJ992_03175 [Gemmatimonadales bacterium]|nr:hypothetical protein [Gemmatimonadales bacterium]